MVKLRLPDRPAPLSRSSWRGGFNDGQIRSHTADQSRRRVTLVAVSVRPALARRMMDFVLLEERRSIDATAIVLQQARVFDPLSILVLAAPCSSREFSLLLDWRMTFMGFESQAGWIQSQCISNMEDEFIREGRSSRLDGWSFPFSSPSGRDPLNCVR